jgi:hypothetical protein
MDALLATLSADVAAARERGRQRDFWATRQELLAELQAAGCGQSETMVATIRQECEIVR